MIIKYKKHILKLKIFSNQLIAGIKSEPKDNESDIPISSEQAGIETAVKLENFTFKREKKLGLKYKETNIQQVLGDCNAIKRSESSVELKRAAVFKQDLSPIKKTKWEPEQWLEQYEKIKEMRSGLTAPVDTMGCDSISRSDPTLTEPVQILKMY